MPDASISEAAVICRYLFGLYDDCNQAIAFLNRIADLGSVCL